ncbi:MerR family transcriptional regulator [Marinomonas epiphytica]
MFIGEVSKLAGISDRVIQKYIKVGLLEPNTKNGRYRVFSDEDLKMIMMIKQAQSFGFQLVDLRRQVESCDVMNLDALRGAINSLINRKIIGLSQQANELLEKVGYLEEFQNELQE